MSFYHYLLPLLLLTKSYIGVGRRTTRTELFGVFHVVVQSLLVQMTVREASAATTAAARLTATWPSPSRATLTAHAAEALIFGGAKSVAQATLSPTTPARNAATGTSPSGATGPVAGAEAGPAPTLTLTPTPVATAGGGTTAAVLAPPRGTTTPTTTCRPLSTGTTTSLSGTRTTTRRKTR